MAERPPIEGWLADTDALRCAPSYGGLPRAKGHSRLHGRPRDEDGSIALRVEDPHPSEQQHPDDVAEAIEEAADAIEAATLTSFAPEVADAVAEDDGGPVEPVQFTATQLREILVIAAADALDAEATHNRWYHQMRAEGWCFGNTNDATRMSSYCRMFHELMPGQQALIAHELTAVIAARGAAD